METLQIKGAKIPRIGLGTYRLKGNEAIDLIQEAISMGYTHLDTAQLYGNEKEVGDAVRHSGARREDLWITTKVWPSELSRDRFLPSVEESLSKLQMDRVDLLLIHWPSQEIPVEEGVEQLILAKEKGYAHHIGVSNFPSKLVERAIGVGADLLNNQVEYHPFLAQAKLKQTLDVHGISMTAYRPIVKGEVNSHPVISAIASKYGKSGVQVSLRWLIQQANVMAIPMTTKVHRLKENMDIFDFSLEESEMEQITALTGAGRRFIDPDWGPSWD